MAVPRQENPINPTTTGTILQITLSTTATPVASPNTSIPPGAPPSPSIPPSAPPNPSAPPGAPPSNPAGVSQTSLPSGLCATTSIDGVIHTLNCRTVSSSVSQLVALSSSFPPQSSTSSSSASTRTSLPNVEPSGVSGGAVAGIAIGCLIAGGAIVGVVLFLLFRHRRSGGVAAVQHHPAYIDGINRIEKGPSVTATPVASNVDSLIPQPVADNSITKELSKLRDNIKDHARSYYHTSSVETVILQESQVAGLADATAVSSSTLLGAFHNPSKRLEAVRSFMAWTILSRCEGLRHPSLLPNDVAPMSVLFSSKAGRGEVQPALYSKWKTITGALLQDRLGANRTDHRPERNVTKQAMVELDSVLAQFARGDSDEAQRHKNLQMILNRAASLALLLFSQPGSFRFDFNTDRGILVVFPGLLQTVNDAAQVIEPPRVLGDKEFEG